MLRYAALCPLNACCTFLTGGRAKRLAYAYAVEDLCEAASAGALVLGRGSNVLVGDYGYDGDVVINRASRIEFEGDKCVCDSGTPLSAVVRAYAAHSRAGMAWAAGIPGTVGGATVGNAGAFGGCMADVIDYVTVARGGRIHTYTPTDLHMSYRHSDIDGVVLSVRLRAPAGDGERIRAEAAQNIAKRRAGQPSGASAGSVFKAAGEVPAAVLIEQAGCKGKTAGGAQISPRHANFIVNRGGATSADILQLMRFMQGEVYDKFGVRLSREIRQIGDFV